VGVELGRLVEREVASRRRRRRDASDTGGVRQAVDDARVVVGELSALIARLELAEAGQSGPLAPSKASAVLFD
jgi:hypothetical protein